jgi:hypothetical protein
MRHRFTAGLLATTFAVGLLAIGAPQARASSKGRRNTAIGLGALAAYGLLSGKTGTGLLAAAGAAYAYKRYNDARKKERRYRYYGSPYGGGSFQFPNQYPYNGYSGGRSYQYQNGYSAPYTTDEWGNRHYYDPRYGDGYHQYGYQPSGYQSSGYHHRGYYRTAGDEDESYARGWRHGEKRGWRGHSVPPGHWRHAER